MKIIKECPVCVGTEFLQKIECKDHTVSGETFSIMECQQCRFLFTSPRPYDVHLPDYYKSNEYISHSDTSSGLINKLYKAVRRLTLRSKLKLIKPYLSNNELLDIGAGTGAFLSFCKEKGINTYGIEPDADARKIASEKHGIDLFTEDALNTLPGDKFSIITMWHVLEHVSDLKEYLVQLKRILHPNGRLVIAVPNHISDDAKRYGKYWAAYDVPRHLYHFSPDTIKILFEKNQFRMDFVKPMIFDAYYVSLLSEKYKTGKSNYLKAFYSGLISNMKGGGDKFSSMIYVFSKIAP